MVRVLRLVRDGRVVLEIALPDDVDVVVASGSGVSEVAGSVATPPPAGQPVEIVPPPPPAPQLPSREREEIEAVRELRREVESVVGVSELEEAFKEAIGAPGSEAVERGDISALMSRELEVVEEASRKLEKSAGLKREEGRVRSRKALEALSELLDTSQV